MKMIVLSKVHFSNIFLTAYLLFILKMGWTKNILSKNITGGFITDVNEDMSSNEYPLHDVQQDSNLLDCKGDEQVDICCLLIFSLLSKRAKAITFLCLCIWSENYFLAFIFDFQLFAGKRPSCCDNHSKMYSPPWSWKAAYIHGIMLLTPKM